MLTVRDTATAARRLYDSAGWVALGRWEPDLTIMGKRLEEGTTVADRGSGSA
jgi:hypothetical protein